jgi:hypothetical protein
MDHGCGVSQCGRPTQDVICSTHLHELVDALKAIATGGVHRVRIHKDWDPINRRHIEREPEYEYLPGLWEDLETTLTRQGKMGRSSVKVHGSGERGAPFHEAASDVKAMTLRAVRHWKAVFTAANPHLSAGPTETAAVCDWLAGFPALLAQLVDAANMHGDFVALAGTREHPHGAIQHVIDRGPDRVYLGICSAPTDTYPCSEDVYAIEGHEWAVCRGCRTEHNVAQRREALRAAMEDVRATAADCSRMADLYGTAVTRERIRKWKQRGQLVQRGTDEFGRPKYRMGDIFDLAAGKTSKEREAA